MSRLLALLPVALLAACGLEGAFNIAAGVGEACSNDSNCRPGLACRDQVCEPNGNTPEGSQCLLSDECAEGLYCSLELRCAAAGEGVAGDACSSPGDCARGFFCRPEGFSGTCEPVGDKDLGADCEDHGECLGGLFCVKGECQPPARLLEHAEEETCPGPGDDAGPPRALFEVPRGGQAPNDFYALPFPNDVRTKDGHPVFSDHPTTGADVLGVDVVKTYLEKAEREMTGFSNNPSVVVRFSGSIKFDSLTGGGADATLRFVDLDTGDSLGMSWYYSPGRNRYVCENHLVVRPQRGRALEGGHTYALVVTKGVTDDAGTPVEADADFEALLAADRPADPDLGLAWDRYAKLRAWIEEEEIDPATLATAAVFTTGQPRRMMGLLYDAAHAEPAPTLSDVTVCAEGVTSPCEAGDEARACGVHEAFTEIHAKVELPVWQEGAAPYRSEGGRISVDAQGNPKVVRREQVCVAITVPKNADAPENGWPVVLYMHGTGGSFRSHVTDGTAASLSAAPFDGATVPFVTIGFDAVNHGPRRGDDDTHPDLLVFNYTNPDAAMGNWLQGSADAFTIVRLAQGLELPAELGTTREGDVSFLGHSQGATHGGLFLSFEEDVKVAMLSGGGGLLIDSLLGKRSPVDIAAAVQTVLLEQSVNAFHPVLALLQSYFDAVDPVNFGDAITRQPPEGKPFKHVFMSYGLGDTYTPPATMQNLALALNLDLANDPALESFGANTVSGAVKGNRRGGQQTAVCQQYDPPAGTDGHFVIFREQDAKRRVAAWFASAEVDPDGVPTLVE